MKRGAPRHPKIADLAERLGVELYAAAGLLELLWHFTGEYAPCGDIGRHTDQAICKAVHWRKSPEKLIRGLMDSHWLDAVDLPCRLVVHDWRDHADDATHMKLARARLMFWDGSKPNLKRLPSAERALAEQFYALPVRTENTQHAHNGEGRVGQGLGRAPEKTVIPEDFSAKEPWDWFCENFLGEIEDGAHQDFVQFVDTMQNLALMRENMPLWMKTVKYQSGHGKSAKWFIRDGTWRRPPDPSMYSKTSKLQQMMDAI